MTAHTPKTSPLTLAEYYVLAALAMQDMHAYLLCDKVARDSDRAIHVSSGWMANLLQRLTAERYVEPLSDVGRGRLYMLTDAGRRRLEREIHQHQRAMIVGQTALDQAARRQTTPELYSPILGLA
jgi:DNA-binding PadR family transcriptional regulator